MFRLKKFFLITLVFAVALFISVPAQAATQDMWATVYKWTGMMNTDGSASLTKLTSGVTFKVVTASADTAETLYKYGDEALTSVTNPVTAANFASATVCNKRVAFRVDPSESGDRYVDVIVTDTNGGYSVFVEDFDKYTHSIIIDERPNVLHHGVIWFSGTTTNEIDTGIDFLQKTFVSDVRIEILTTSIGTMDIGLLSSETGGDANGLRMNLSLASSGFIKDTAVITNGSTTDYTPASTYGALLVTALTGTDATGDTGGKSYLGHIVDKTNAKSLTYSVNTSISTPAGYIHYFFTRMR